MPAFSHYFGLRPWDIERLTFDEIDEYQRALRQLTKPHKTRRTR